jgi:hypothetical protein
MAKRKASEVWTALEEEDVDAEIEAALAMTPEERRRELRAAGFDLDEVHARADALGAGPARSEPIARVRTLRRVLIIAPVALALAAGVAIVVRPYLALYDQHLTAPAPIDEQADRAAALRTKASDACGAKRWDECIEKLDEAKALDPRGDNDREPQALRRMANEGRGTP